MQRDQLMSVKKRDRRVGDIVVLHNGGHVGIYVGHNKIIHASNRRAWRALQQDHRLVRRFRRRLPARHPYPLIPTAPTHSRSSPCLLP